MWNVTKGLVVPPSQFYLLFPFLVQPNHQRPDSFAHQQINNPTAGRVQIVVDPAIALRRDAIQVTRGVTVLPGKVALKIGTLLIIGQMPWAIYSAIEEQTPQTVPSAWLYPPETTHPHTAELQIVYFFTLDLGVLDTLTERNSLCALPLTALPKAITQLDLFLIETVREAESRYALPLIDLRPVTDIIHIIGETRYASYEQVRVIGGGKFAEYVADYIGYCGIVTGVTNTQPHWFSVQLDVGKQIAALPHHIESLVHPEPEVERKQMPKNAPNIQPSVLSLDLIGQSEANLHTLARCLKVQSHYSEAACRKALQVVLALHSSSPVETTLALLNYQNEGLEMPTIVQQFRKAAGEYLREHPRHTLLPREHQFIWSHLQQEAFPSQSSTDQLYIYGSHRSLTREEMLLSNVGLAAAGTEKRIFLGPCYEAVKCYCVTSRRLTGREQETYHLTLLHSPPDE
jgi:hypothetical protein